MRAWIAVAATICAMALATMAVLQLLSVREESERQARAMEYAKSACRDIHNPGVSFAAANAARLDPAFEPLATYFQVAAEFRFWEPQDNPMRLSNVRVREALPLAAQVQAIYPSVFVICGDLE